MAEYEIVWNGARDHYLTADGPYLSTAARAVAEGDRAQEMAPSKPKRRSTRGFRAPGSRLRDLVLGKLLVSRPMTLAQVCAQVEAQSEHEISHVARALLTLVQEKRARREKRRPGPKLQARWAYWRLP